MEKTSVKRPVEIPTRDWLRLAKHDAHLKNHFPEPPMDDSGRPVHCKYDHLARVKYAHMGLSTNVYLTRLDVLDHIEKANHVRGRSW